MKPLTDMQLESIVSKARAIVNLHSFGALKLAITFDFPDTITIAAAPGLTDSTFTDLPAFVTGWQRHRDMEISFALQYIGTLAGDHFVGLLMSLESLDTNPFDATQDTIGALPPDLPDIDISKSKPYGVAVKWSPDSLDDGPSLDIGEYPYDHKLAPCWLEYIESMDLSDLDEDKLP